jgi:hypothetical protein
VESKREEFSYRMDSYLTYRDEEFIVKETKEKEFNE